MSCPDLQRQLVSWYHLYISDQRTWTSAQSLSALASMFKNKTTKILVLIYSTLFLLLDDSIGILYRLYAGCTSPNTNAGGWQTNQENRKYDSTTIHDVVGSCTMYDVQSNLRLTIIHIAWDFDRKS
jgi:hypothetical protein